MCTVVTLANWDWFKEWEDGKVNKRGFEYDRIKNNIGDRMWEQVVKHFPQLKDKVSADMSSIIIVMKTFCF